MANESKNRVKLNKEYKRIGFIPKTALAKVNEHFKVPADANDIRSNTDNMLKHNRGHLAALEKALDELGITKEGYAEYIAKNFNQIRLGNKPRSLVLAVKNETTSHLAAVHLFFDKNENFWLVKSVHAERLADLERMTLVWEK